MALYLPFSLSLFITFLLFYYAPQGASYVGERTRICLGPWPTSGTVPRRAGPCPHPFRSGLPCPRPFRSALPCPRPFRSGLPWGFTPANRAMTAPCPLRSWVTLVAHPLVSSQFAPCLSRICLLQNTFCTCLSGAQSLLVLILRHSSLRLSLPCWWSLAVPRDLFSSGAMTSRDGLTQAHDP